MKRLIAAVVIIAVGATAWFVIRGRKGDANSYRFVTVEKGEIESVVSSTGTLRATSTVQVGTQVSGQIEAIYVDFNDHVKQGELIARIDPTLLQQDLRAARTSVERSRADLDQSQREMERAERLYSGKVITESEYTTAQYQLALSKASYESAQINLDKAERNLRYTEIRAPVDGTVLERNVDVGQTVAASLSAPQLFLIAGDLSQMEILALVDESDIGKIEPDQDVTFTVQAFPDRTFHGKVSQVRLQSTTQENVVNYMVTVSVENKDGKLLPGMTATVEFIVKRAEDVFKVSNAALRFQPTDAMRAEVREKHAGSWRGAGGDSARAARGGRGDGSGGGGFTGSGRNRGGSPGGGSFGGAGNGSGGWSRNGARRSDRGVLWIVDANGKVDIVPVKTGITDGQSTEIEGPNLTEGMEVIAGVVSSSTSTAAANPFESQGGGRGRGPRPGF